MISNVSSVKALLSEFSALGIADQIDYKKFYLYSIITHSTAIEGSTVTEVENQLLFDQGISASKRTITEQLMNLDLKAAYEKSMHYSEKNEPYSVEMLKSLSALVMKNTGSAYNTINGVFDARNGDLRLVNVSAGAAGKSYMSFQKVPAKLKEFCEWLNMAISKTNKNDTIEAYRLSFEAHYRLVAIHPWVDGNGRMSRLVMNQVQTQLGLLPTIVHKERKAEYIESLAKSEDAQNSSLFIDFMFAELKAFLEENIANFKKSMDDDFVGSGKISFAQSNTPQVTPEVTPQVKKLLLALKSEMSRSDLMLKLKLKDYKNFNEKYIVPALKSNCIEMTQPNSPRSPTQKYRLTKLGNNILLNLNGNEDDDK